MTLSCMVCIFWLPVQLPSLAPLSFWQFIMFLSVNIRRITGFTISILAQRLETESLSLFSECDTLFPVHMIEVIRFTVSRTGSHIIRLLLIENISAVIRLDAAPPNVCNKMLSTMKNQPWNSSTTGAHTELLLKPTQQLLCTLSL